MKHESNHHLIDLSYLEELSKGDPGYQKQVLGIFLENTRKVLSELEEAVRKKDWEETHRHAHALKSGLGIVRIRGMLEGMQELDLLAQQGDGSRIPQLFGELLERFRAAEPQLEAHAGNAA